MYVYGSVSPTDCVDRDIKNTWRLFYCIKASTVSRLPRFYKCYDSVSITIKILFEHEVKSEQQRKKCTLLWSKSNHTALSDRPIYVRVTKRFPYLPRGNSNVMVCVGFQTFVC